MKNRLDNLLKGINLANFEGLKTVDVEIDDLVFLRSVIKDYQDAIIKAQREINTLSAKVVLKDMERPVSLRSFIDVRC